MHLSGAATRAQWRNRKAPSRARPARRTAVIDASRLAPKLAHASPAPRGLAEEAPAPVRAADGPWHSRRRGCERRLPLPRPSGAASRCAAQNSAAHAFLGLLHTGQRRLGCAPIPLQGSALSLRPLIARPCAQRKEQRNDAHGAPEAASDGRRRWLDGQPPRAAGTAGTSVADPVRARTKARVCRLPASFAQSDKKTARAPATAPACVAAQPSPHCPALFGTSSARCSGPACDEHPLPASSGLRG